MAFTLQIWSFDLDSDTLGPTRCRHFDASKKFLEFEAAIRGGTIDSEALARNIFQTVARKRTGVTEIDAKCGGDKFSDDEVSTLSLEELDDFCEKLLKGRLSRTVTAVDDPMSPPAPDFPRGRAGLAPALLYFEESRRASMKRLVESAEKSLRPAFDIEKALGGKAAIQTIQEAYRAENMLKTAFGNLDITSIRQIVQENQRGDDIFKATAGISRQFGPLLDQISVRSGAVDIFAHDSLKKSLGLNGAMKDFLRDKSSLQSALGSMTAASSLEEKIRGLTTEPRTSVRAISDPTELPSTFQHIPVYVPPRNPIHKTNDTLDALLAHRQAEAAKKDGDRSEAATESGENRKVAHSGLKYSKNSFWLAFIAFIFPTAWGVWGHFDAKKDAAESEKKFEIQIKELRAEIRTLEAQKLKTDKSTSMSDADAIGKLKPDVKQDHDKASVNGPVRSAP
jgi:hypothetical protein